MLRAWCLPWWSWKASWLLWGFRHRHRRWWYGIIYIEGFRVDVTDRWVALLISSVLTWIRRWSVAALKLRLLGRDLWAGICTTCDLLRAWVIRRNWLLLGESGTTLDCGGGRVQRLVERLVQLGLRLIGLEGFIRRYEVEDGLALCIGSGFSVGMVSGHSGR